MQNQLIDLYNQNSLNTNETVKVSQANKKKDSLIYKKEEYNNMIDQNNNKKLKSIFFKSPVKIKQEQKTTSDKQNNQFQICPFEKYKYFN